MSVDSSIHLARELTLPIEPIPCPRPRISRFGAYYPTKYRKWKAQFAKLIQKAWRDGQLTCPVAIEIDIVCKRPAKTKLSTPRPDVDNYAKAVLDGCNQIVWDDDTRVIYLRVTKRWAAKNEPGRIHLCVAWDTSLAPLVAAGTISRGIVMAMGTASVAERTSTGTGDSARVMRR